MPARTAARKPPTKAPPARGGPKSRARPGARAASGPARPPEAVTIGIVGIGGHVGVAMAVAFAHYGHRVVGTEVVAASREKVAAGEAPFFDPGLDEELRAAVEGGRLQVVADRASLVRRADVIFLCLPTPSRPDGSVDTSFLEEEAKHLGEELRRTKEWRLIVVKSTSPPGTSQRVEEILARESGKAAGEGFAVGANPEFLAEGCLVKDALEPSRIVLGVSDARSEGALREAYAGFPSERVVLPPAAAELVKYASNALLAVKVSFANELARVAERTGADVYPVMRAVGLDPRLAPGFLKAGPGFGGSCFPKDLKGLVALAHQAGLVLPVTEGALAVNETQARHVVDLAERAEGGRLAGREVALLGLSFKAGTDDVRESRAYPILGELLKRGALVRLHDPKAMAPFVRGLPPLLAKELGARVRESPRLEEAVRGADLVLLQTDWPEYRDAPASLWKQTRDRLVVDARRSVDPKALAKAGVRYVALGDGTPEA